MDEAVFAGIMLLAVLAVLEFLGRDNNDLDLPF